MGVFCLLIFLHKGYVWLLQYSPKKGVFAADFSSQKLHLELLISAPKGYVLLAYFLHKGCVLFAYFSAHKGLFFVVYAQPNISHKGVLQLTKQIKLKNLVNAHFAKSDNRNKSSILYTII